MNIEKNKEVAREIARSYVTLSTDNLTRLAEILIPMRFRRGTIILHEGEVCNYMYYVERGLIRQYYMKKGREVTEHISYEGGMVICIESFFLHQPSRLMIHAIEQSVVYAIPYNKLLSLTEESYEFCRLMFKIMERSLIISQQKADTLRFETAQERYHRTMTDHPDIVRRTPLHYIASYLQMTPETLSRVRSKSNEY